MAAGLSGCPQAPEQKAGTPPPPDVATIAVALAGVTQRLELTGDVHPMSTVLLTSKVPGRLERLGIEDKEGVCAALSEGSRVRRGDVLAQIDLTVYATRLKQTQAAFSVADAQFRDAEREEERMTGLFRGGSATEQMRDRAVTARRIAEAVRAQMEAALALAGIDSDEARPKSPIDGVVTRKHVDEGNIVSVGMPLVTIEELSRVKVVFAVPERYLAGIVPGKTRVRVACDALPNGSIEDVAGKVYPAVDPATRSGMVEVVLDNAGGRLRSGNFVHVLLDVAHADGAVVIPLSAITWQGQEAFVFVVENGKARRRAIEVGIREPERCQVIDGLKAGEVLVVAGFRNLLDGDAVTAQARGGQ
jgi:membrane fusion protein (multidrug efflux system)